MSLFFSVRLQLFDLVNLTDPEKSSNTPFCFLLISKAGFLFRDLIIRLLTAIIFAVVFLGLISLIFLILWIYAVADAVKDRGWPLMKKF
ncbi:MAG: hypothetical protein ABI441_03015, partial [Flavobacterium sp.]